MQHPGRMHKEKPCYSLCIIDTEDTLPTDKDLTRLLQKDEKNKEKAMKQLITQAMEGNTALAANMLMAVVQNVFPCQGNKILKKLCYLLFELCPKTCPDTGKARSEMVLICNALRNDLLHPNEYLRGAALRFVAHLQEWELIEPLSQPVFECLEHKHSYVRKHAVQTVAVLYRHHPEFFQTTPQRLLAVLDTERDSLVLRATLLGLLAIDPNLLGGFLARTKETTAYTDEVLLVLVQCMACQSDCSKHAALLRILAMHSSDKVSYAAICALLHAGCSAMDTKRGMERLVGMIKMETNNNMKITLLRKLLAIQKSTGISITTTDLLPELLATDTDVVRLAIEFALAAMAYAAAVAAVQLLGAERSSWIETARKEILISFLGNITLRFPLLAEQTIPLLFACLLCAETALPSAQLQKILTQAPEKSEMILKTAQPLLLQTKKAPVLKELLVLVQEATTELDTTITTISCALENLLGAEGQPLQKTLLLQTLCAVLTALLPLLNEQHMPQKNKTKAKIMLVLTRLCQTTAEEPQDSIAFNKAASALNILQNSNEVYLDTARPATAATDRRSMPATPVDAPLSFGLSKTQPSTEETHSARSLSQILGSISTKTPSTELLYELSGHTDCLFVEVHVLLDGPEIELDFLCVNQTDHAIEDCFLELTLPDTVSETTLETAGLTIYPKSFLSIRRTLKINTLATPKIFPSVSYGTVTETVQELLQLTLPVSLFVSSVSLDTAEFRAKWAEMEWENNIEITPLQTDSPQTFVQELLKHTSFGTSSALYGGEATYTINISAEDCFSQLLLGNISLSWQQGKLSGEIRLRGTDQQSVKDTGRMFVQFLKRMR